MDLKQITLVCYKITLLSEYTSPVLFQHALMTFKDGVCEDESLEWGWVGLKNICYHKRMYNVWTDKVKNISQSLTIY